MRLAVIARRIGLLCVSEPRMLPIENPSQHGSRACTYSSTACTPFGYRAGTDIAPIIGSMKTRLLQADAPEAVVGAAAAVGRGALGGLPLGRGCGPGAGGGQLGELHGPDGRPEEETAPDL